MTLQLSLRVERYTGVDTFGRRRLLLEEVAVEAASPGIVVVVGESGAGKTSLLRAILGARRARETLSCDLKISCDGEDSSVGALGTQGQLGVVDQVPAFLPWLRVRANLMLPTLLNPTLTAPETPILLEGLRRLRLVSDLDTAEAILDRYPSELSGGQLQRLCILRALAYGPRLLILDEATSALDPRTRTDVFNLLDDYVAERDALCILTTHQHREATRVADRIIALRAGKCVGKEEVIEAA